MLFRSEKREVVQLTLRPGASVAEVARAHGVNANQVFKWRRAFERGELTEPSTALIPVTVTSQQDESSETGEVATPAACSRRTSKPESEFASDQHHREKLYRALERETDAKRRSKTPT